MLFQDLPELGATPADQTQILVGDNGALSRTDNLFDQMGDAEMVRLVLAKIAPSDTLNQHINDRTIHSQIADTTVSPNSTWSSARVDSAIAGSNPWFNLDSVPEGTTNLYYTPERAKAVIAATTQGVPVIDHKAIATQLVSVLMGFNSTTFRYNRSNTPAGSNVTVTVDGGPATTNYFEVTPGVRNLQFTGGGLYEAWVCDELAHSVTFTQSGSTVVTPRLTLDSFQDGTVNKFWNSSTFGGSALAQSIAQHLTNPTFAEVHARINDNAGQGTSDATWSSNKIINFISSEIAKNRVAVAVNAKAIYVGHETAASGQNASGYTWETLTSGATFTHYVTRNPANPTYNPTSSGVFTSGGQFYLQPGTWLVYWDADMTLRSGVFAGVTSPMTYISLGTTPRVPILTVPGTITVTSANYYRMVSRFSTTTAFNSSFQNTWLQPQAITGVNELYATLHLERVR